MRRLVILLGTLGAPAVAAAQSGGAPEPEPPLPRWSGEAAPSLLPPGLLDGPDDVDDAGLGDGLDPAPLPELPFPPIPGLGTTGFVPDTGSDDALPAGGPSGPADDDPGSAGGRRLTPVPDLPDLPELARRADRPRVDWHTNPRKARALAEEEGKYLILAFVGLDWNVLSRRLNDEVFSSEAFAEFGARHLVCAYLDFPQNQEKAHPLYHRFKEVCDVRGLPAVAIFAPDGKLIETLNGFSPNKSAHTYLYELRDRIANDQTRLAAESRERRRLEEQGYRHWSNTEGRTVFARLRGLAEERVYLEEPDGTRSAVPIKTLAFVDREVARRLWARRQEQASTAGASPPVGNAGHP